MIITEFIRELEEVFEKCGDIEIVMVDLKGLGVGERSREVLHPIEEIAIIDTSDGESLLAISLPLEDFELPEDTDYIN